MKYRLVIANCSKDRGAEGYEPFEKHIIEAPTAADAITIGGLKLRFPWSDPNNNQYHSHWRELRDIEWVPELATDWLTEEDRDNARLILYAVNSYSNLQAEHDCPNATARPWSITTNEAQQITIAGPDSTDRIICHIMFPEKRQ